MKLRTFKILWVLGAVLGLAFNVGLVYIIIHFVLKYW